MNRSVKLSDPEFPVLDDDVIDAEPVTADDLGLSIDLIRDELEDTDDGLGFRALFERPEIVLRGRAGGWPHAA